MSRKPLGFMQLTIICGFGMFYAWYLIAFFGLFMFVQVEIDFVTLHVGQTVFFAGSILTTLVFLGLFTQADSVAIGHKRPLFLVSLIPGSTLPACVIAYSLGIDLPFWLFYAACFLAGVSIGVGFMLWEDVSKHGYLKYGVFAHGIIFCGGGLAFLVGTAFLSSLENAVLAEIFLCASTALLAFIAPRCDTMEDKPVAPAHEYFRSVWHLDVVIVVINVAFGYAFMLLFQLDNMTLLATMGIAIVCDLAFSFAFGRGKLIAYAGSARMCVAVISCALILFVCPGDAVKTVALCVIVVFWFLFRTMNSGSCTDLANRHDFSALYTATRGKLPVNTGFLLGLILGLTAIASGVETIASFYLPLALVAAFILSALFLLPFDSESATAGYRTLALVNMHESPETDLRRVCDEMTHRFKLSPRESETLAYLVRGRNAKHISEKLYISESTAKTHISNIYRKVGVHSQQELLDSLDEL